MKHSSETWMASEKPIVRWCRAGRGEHYWNITGDPSDMCSEPGGGLVLPGCNYSLHSAQRDSLGVSRRDLICRIFMARLMVTTQACSFFPSDGKAFQMKHNNSALVSWCFSWLPDRVAIDVIYTALFLRRKFTMTKFWYIFRQPINFK